jgi:uncharacterized protein (TIGR02300 family)
MPKEEWGVKRVCPKCSVRFYDLQNDPMTCPSCGAVFDLASLTNVKNRSVSPERALKEAKPVVEADLDDTADVLDDDDDVDTDLDDDLLDDDDDDTVNLDDIADVPSESDDS